MDTPIQLRERPLSEIFDQAADLIEARGWRRGPDDGTQCLCLVDAVGAAHEPRRSLAHAIGHLMHVLEGRPSVWNDTRSSAEEVLTLLRTEANKCRARGD